jgi:hypothetical protein
MASRPPTRKIIPGAAFDDRAQELMRSILALVVAAGGTIVVKPDVMGDGSWKLIVEQDSATGVKTYRAEHMPT